MVTPSAIQRPAPLVLLAAYQGASFLPQQLDSLTHQTIPFRALLRDDGSQDATPALLADICRKDTRFSLSPTSGKHLGVTNAFRALMQEAATQACDVALCDQDDVWHPDKLATLQAAMAEAEARYGSATPLLVHSDGRVIDAQGALLHASLMRHQGWDTRATSLPELLMQTNVTGCMLMMNSALCRLAAAHMPDRNLHMHDWFIALTAAAFGQVIALSQPLVDYRQHGHNAMGASASGLWHRAAKALHSPEQAKRRIALSYHNAAQFLAAYEGLLPADKAAILHDFVRIPTLPKLHRLLALSRGGFRMQSRLARLGVLIFA